MNKSDLIKEIIHCGRDPKYFINTYARIQHPVAGLVPFKLYPFQEDILDRIHQSQKKCYFKSKTVRRYDRYGGLYYLVYFIP